LNWKKGQVASKRVHEIAKEQNLSSRELLEALRAAGLEVTAAASSVDEDEALRILKSAGDSPTERQAKSPTKPRTPAALRQKPAAKAAPKAPAAPAPTPAEQRSFDPGEGVDTGGNRVFEPDVVAPIKPSSAGGKREPALPPAPKPTAAPKPKSDSQPPPKPTPKPKAPVGQPPPKPVAPVAAPEPSAAEKTPDSPAEPEPAAPIDEIAAAATVGPKIIAQPDKPKRTPRKPASPADAGGKRRVVIDSQANRRPGGGPPPGGFPQRRPRRRGRRKFDDTPLAPLDTSAQSATDAVRVNSGATVKDISEYLGVPVPDLIKQLMMMGEMATLTQTLSDEAIVILAEALGKEVEIVTTADEEAEELIFADEEVDLVERPPVVTIMGHVDHGKTSLLDAIRKTEVVAGEAGGITQHIGAYQVHHDGRLITFLDTPGHEAFTAMRARGAHVTDIAVIVVAADDGPKPQTDEAIDHARAAGVPIVVAVNKVDKEGADPTRVRTEMTERKLQPAEWGGETEYVDVSAKSGAGLDELLETLLVVSELEDLKANPDAEASGIIVESRLDPGRGPVVTVLIQRGTLKVGDAFVAGAHWGKARAMHDHTGAVRDAAMPGDPVELLGFDGVPDAGEVLRVTKNEKVARQQAEERQTRMRNEAAARRSGRKVSFDDLFSGIQEGVLKDLNLVLKADVSGSLEAFEDEIAKLPQDEISVNIIHRGVGGINESDVMLAAASDAIILGFNVRPVGDARAASDREGVEIRSYSVIYKALEELRDAMTGMLEPEEVEDALGSAEVRQTFKASKVGTIAGCQVTSGKLVRNAHVRVVRDGTVVYETTIDSLKRFNDDAKEVAEGFECGIVLANFQDVKEGDMLEAYTTRKVERQLA
jgi:translation initiation factor IF-2